MNIHLLILELNTQERLQISLLKTVGKLTAVFINGDETLKNGTIKIERY